MSSSPTSSLADALSQLHLEHRQQLDSLLVQQHSEISDLIASLSGTPSLLDTTVLPPVSATVVPSQPSSPAPSAVPSTPPSSVALCRHGRPLFLGSPVRLLSSATSGKIGDTAVVTRPTSAAATAFVSLRLDSTGTNTTRRAANLELIE